MGENARVMMASTPPTGESGIEGVLNNKHPITGKSICTQINLEFECPACKIRILTDPGWICTERLHLRPPHQSVESLYVAIAAFGDNIDSLRREMFGVTVRDSHEFIEKRYMDILASSKPVRGILNSPHYVFVSVDPNGSCRNWIGGHTSDYAIVTAIIHEGRYVVYNFYLFLFIFLYPMCLDIIFYEWAERRRCRVY